MQLFFRYPFFFSLLAPVIIYFLVIFAFVISLLLSCLVESCHVGYSSALLPVSSLVSDSPDLSQSNASAVTSSVEALVS